MELLSTVIGFFIGLIFFYLLNTWFDIVYFGCGAISGVFTGCWIAGFLIVFLLFYYLKYIIILLIVLALLVKIFHRKKPQEGTDGETRN